MTPTSLISAELPSAISPDLDTNGSGTLPSRIGDEIPHGEDLLTFATILSSIFASSTQIVPLPPQYLQFTTSNGPDSLESQSPTDISTDGTGAVSLASPLFVQGTIPEQPHAVPSQPIDALNAHGPASLTGQLPGFFDDASKGVLFSSPRSSSALASADEFLPSLNDPLANIIETGLATNSIRSSAPVTPTQNASAPTSQELLPTFMRSGLDTIDETATDPFGDSSSPSMQYATIEQPASQGSFKQESDPGHDRTADQPQWAPIDWHPSGTLLDPKIPSSIQQRIVSPHELFSTLLNDIRDAARAGDSLEPRRLEIEVRPPDLGRVLIEVARVSTGLKVEIQADQMQTLEILRNRASELSHELSLSKIPVATMTFSSGHSFAEKNSSAPQEPELVSVSRTSKPSSKASTTIEHGIRA